MSITSFNEIPGLLFVVNPADESTVTKTGNEVTQVVPSEQGAGENAVFLPSNDDPGVLYVQHGVDSIEMIPAFSTNASASAHARLLWTRDTVFPATSPFTVCLVEKRSDYRDSKSFYIQASGNSPTTLEVNANRNQSDLNSLYSISNVDYDTGIDITFGETRYVTLSNDHSVANGSHYDVNGLVHSGVGNIGTTSWNRFFILGFDNRDLVTGIVAVYNRVLTVEEKADVRQLIQYWVENGEAPSTEPSGTFNITVDKPTAPGIAFQWEESSDNTNWQNVGTILTDTTGADTDTLTINSATVAMHQTYVRCQVTTSFDGFDISDPAQLLIEGQPV